MKKKYKKTLKHYSSSLKKSAKKVAIYKKRATNRPFAKKVKKVWVAICEIIGGLTVLVLVISSVPTKALPGIAEVDPSELPLAPTKLVAKVNNSTVTISWQDKSKNKADEYRVYRYDDVSGKYVDAPKNQILSVFSKSYVSGENDAGKSYSYKIAGVKNLYKLSDSVPTQILGPLSEPININIPKAKRPAVPTDFRAVVKNSSIFFSWKGDADWYVLEKYDPALKKYILESPESGIQVDSFAKRAYEPGKAYKFRLSSCNNVYNLGVVNDVLKGPAYVTISVKIPAAKPPLQPTGLKHKINKEKTIQLSWNNPSLYSHWGLVTTDLSGVDGYKVMYYNETSRDWLELRKDSYRFESDRVMSIFGQPAGRNIKYRIMGYKMIYDELTRELVNLDGPYSKPITIKAP